MSLQLQRPEPAFLASSSLALGAQEAGGSLVTKALTLLTDVATCVYTKAQGPQALARESFRSAAMHTDIHGPFRGGAGGTHTGAGSESQEVLTRVQSGPAVPALSKQYKAV